MPPLQQANAALTDGASVATMLRFALALIIAIVPALITIRSAGKVKIAANEAELRAAAAEKRADDALKLAALATAALESMKVLLCASVQFERARPEAPALLELWLSKALNEGKDDDTGYNMVYQHGPLGTLSEILAAQLATNHDRVVNCSSPPYQLGMPFMMTVSKMPPARY